MYRPRCCMLSLHLPGSLLCGLRTNPFGVLCLALGEFLFRTEDDEEVTSLVRSAVVTRSAAPKTRAAQLLATANPDPDELDAALDDGCDDEGDDLDREFIDDGAQDSDDERQLALSLVSCVFVL
jgi:hypothetical protein